MNTSILDLSWTERSLSDSADGTGGTFLYNSNDLETGFKSLAEGPESVYLLELSLDNAKPDGASHSLKVKVDRVGLKIQARRGYFIPRPEKTKNSAVLPRQSRSCIEEWRTPQVQPGRLGA